MALVEQDFLVEQGSTFILQFDLKKDDDIRRSLVYASNYDHPECVEFIKHVLEYGTEIGPKFALKC